MATGLKQVLDHLQQAGGGLTDKQLLARFVAARDEAAFAALVRRHGPLVLGVCRRVLHDWHEAEDAFQATFLVLARKAASLVVGESLGCWLYGVAYRTALEAHTMSARRRARERPMADAPHPAVLPAEAQDWRPLLDRELARLPEKYRAAVVLCDLEGRPRREAAGLLGINGGTLSSRLARARTLLAKRLAGCGVALPAGALAAVLSEGGASAQVAPALVSSTARAAVMAAAGQLAAATPAAVLMKEVMKAMLLKKLRLAVGAVMVAVAFGAVGLAYRAGDGSGAAYAAEKPRNELEALRRENELLKLNLEVVLEKVRAQENELRALRARPTGSGMGLGTSSSESNSLGSSSTTSLGVLSSSISGGKSSLGSSSSSSSGITSSDILRPSQGSSGGTLAGTSGVLQQPGQQGANASKDPSDPVKDAEAALKQLRQARDPQGRRRATEALEKVLEKLKAERPPTGQGQRVE
jgi:RNA polymerase sigma factor (sigma-70 family)